MKIAVFLHCFLCAIHVFESLQGGAEHPFRIKQVGSASKSELDRPSHPGQGGMGKLG